MIYLFYSMMDDDSSKCYWCYQHVDKKDPEKYHGYIFCSRKCFKLGTDWIDHDYDENYFDRNDFEMREKYSRYFKYFKNIVKIVFYLMSLIFAYLFFID